MALVKVLAGCGFGSCYWIMLVILKIYVIHMMRIGKIYVHIYRGLTICDYLGWGTSPLSEVLGGHPHPHPQFLHRTPLNWENSLMIAHKGAAVASMWLGNCFLHATIPSPFSCMALLYNLAQLCDCFQTIFFCLVSVHLKKSIIESVDSISRDGTDTPYM